MTDLIYPKAILDLAPADKQGYAPGFPSPQPKEGFVLHSMVGDYPAARARLMGTDRASWHFSVLRDGRVFQHFRDPRAVAWHCGVLGDLDTFTAAVGNLTLIGIEHEGGPAWNVSEPLTAPQLTASIGLQRWLYSVVAELKRPALRASHWEHNWLSATACPSGRFTAIWPTILTSLQEDDMFGEDERNKLNEVWQKVQDIWSLDDPNVPLIVAIKDIQTRLTALEAATGTGPRTVKLEGTLE